MSHSDSESDYDMEKKFHELNTYNKREILKHLEANGADVESCNALIQKFKRVKPDTIEDYINNLAHEAQKNSSKSCKNEVHTRLEKWLEFLEGEGSIEKCKYEIPLMLKIIAEFEDHPTAGEKDIDFKNLYNYLSDIMKGIPPTNKLNCATEQFLMETFEELMESVKIENSLEKLDVLKTMIVKNNEENPNVVKSDSLNPLNIEKYLK